MQLDPQARAVLERVARANLPAYSQLGATAARALYRETRGKLSAAPPEVARVTDLRANGPAGDIAVRLYRPLGAPEGEAVPVLVYFHGGGWTIGDLDTHDVPCREFANLAHCAVVSVDYRLAPEHKFPGAFDDAVAATHWVHAHADALGVDASRLAVGGDSAGGNPRGRGRDRVPRQLGAAHRHADAHLPGDRHGGRHAFARGVRRRLHAHARRDPLVQGQLPARSGRRADWRASPLRAGDFRGLPPAYVITAGFDPLLDEGRAYADRLRAAGVKVTYECFAGMIHGFVTMGGAIAAAHHAISRASLALKQAFAQVRA